MNLIVHTEKSIDKPEIYISTENENADLLLKKTPNLIKNINNNKNFIASSSQPKINRLTNKSKVVVSHRERIKTPEKNRLIINSIITTPLSRCETEKTSLKKYGTKTAASFLSTSITNCSHHKTNPNEVIEGNCVHELC